MKNFKTNLFTKYLSLYEKDPSSRVFAPLAEAYRKQGLYDEAFKILKKGIKFHPDYQLGYIVLAQCYFDKSQFELCYHTLIPFAHKDLDNNLLQKIFASVSEKLGYLSDALQAYKCLLLINPSDKEISRKVNELEKEIWEPREGSIDDTLTNNLIETEELNTDQDPADWSVQDSSLVEIEDQWQMNDTSGSEESEFSNLGYLDNDYNEVENIEAPLISHNLVDLFVERGMIGNAVEVLKNILAIHPDDEVTQRRLNELSENLQMSGPSNQEPEHYYDNNEVEIEEDDIFNDEIVENYSLSENIEDELKSKVHDKFENFLVLIKERSQEIKSKYA